MLLPATLLPLFLPTLMAPSPGAEGGSPFAPLLMMALIFVIFYFLLIRPQQQQAKKHQQMLKGIKKGDRVLTQSGIYGRVVGVGDHDVTIQVAKDVDLQMTKAAVTGILSGDDKK